MEEDRKFYPRGIGDGPGWYGEESERGQRAIGGGLEKVLEADRREIGEWLESDHMGDQSRSESRSGFLASLFFTSIRCGSPVGNRSHCIMHRGISIVSVMIVKSCCRAAIKVVSRSRSWSGFFASFSYTYYRCGSPVGKHNSLHSARRHLTLLGDSRQVVLPNTNKT